MCLYIGENCKKQIAEEDIICYKVVCKDLTSPCMNFQYEVGKEYELGDELTPVENCHAIGARKIYYSVINEGFHTFILSSTADNNISNSRTWKRHLYPYSTRSTLVATPVMLECIIPKGSEYYEGSDFFMDNSRTCYVSNRIKVVKIVEQLEEF